VTGDEAEWMRAQRHNELSRMRAVALGYGSGAVALAACSRLTHGPFRPILLALAAVPGLAAAWTALVSIGVSLLVRGADRLSEK
jgi:predicted esterase